MAGKKNRSYMTIEPAPPAPKTFTDGPIEPGWGAGGANDYNTSNAKSGGSISPIQRTSYIPRSNPMRKT